MTAKIATSKLLGYALPSIPLSMLGMMIVVYMPQFYAAEIGLDLAALGGVFFLARFWDALIDPVVGNLSDRTKSRWGRRKPWIAAGLPLLMLGFYFFTSPPGDAGLSYLLFVTLFFYIAYTVVNIPYLSWGAELSRDYAERNRINGFRETGTMIGVVLATSIPLFYLQGTNPTPADIVRVFAISFLVLMPLTTILSLMMTPQPENIGKREPVKFHQSLGLIRRNKPFLILLGIMLLVWLGGGIYNATSFFLALSVLQLNPEQFLWLLLLQYAFGIVCMPLHVRLGTRMGKHKSLLFIGLSFFIVLPMLLLVEPGNFMQIAIVYALKGAVTAAIWVMPPGLVADTIEYGLYKGVGDNTALYMSLYFFIQKLAMALGIGVALPLAAWVGFNPQDPASATAGLKFVSVILPIFFALPAAFMLFSYPITENRHRALRRRLVRRGQNV